MDLRVKKTRKNIIDAFIQLRAKKPLEKITVKELSDLAMINKATFYLHFQDIYDLCDSLETEIIQSVIKMLPEEDYLTTNPYELVKMAFDAFASEGQLFEILFSGNRMDAFPNKIEKEIKEFIFHKHPEYRNNPEKEILFSVLILGSFHACYNNLHYGKTVVMETIAEIIDCTAKKFQ